MIRHREPMLCAALLALTSCVASAAPSTEAAPVQNGDGLVDLEAEDYYSQIGTDTHSWSLIEDTEASGGQAMDVGEDVGAFSSDRSVRMNYRVTFTQTGTHYVWIRGRAWPRTGTIGGANSVNVGLGGEIPATSDKISGFDETYSWQNMTMDSDRASVHVAATGVQEIEICMREDGFVCDRIILTTDPYYAPDAPVIFSDYLPPSPWPVVTYQDPGGWETIDVTSHGLLPNTDTDAAAAISNIIVSTEGRRRLFFPAGTYTLKSTLTIEVGDIWLDGEGADTEFLLDFPEGQVVHGIVIQGNSSPRIDLSSAPLRGAPSVELNEPGSVEAGDLVWVYHRVLNTKGGYWNRGQISKVTGVQDSVVSLDLKIGSDLWDACYLEKLVPLKNVRCTNFAIRRLRYGDNGDNNLYLLYCYNLELRNIDSSWATTSNIRLQSCKDAIVTECHVHETWNDDDGHHGYGVTVLYSTGVNVVNNMAKNLRHHFELIKGTSYSVMAYNVADPGYDYCDVGSHHSNLGYCNLFEGNKGGEITLDGANWDASHYTFFFRNRASKMVGNYKRGDSIRPLTVIVGNEAKAVMILESSDPYVGANIVDGTLEWGDAPTGARFPASLFLDERPAYLAPDEWPKYGPPAPEEDRGVPTDADGDGMHDAWEALYFGGTNAADGAAGLDADGDGSDNLSEFLAGTSPRDPESVFKIVQIGGVASNAPLKWLSVTNRVYDVFVTTNLLAPWPVTPVVSGTQGDVSGTNVYMVGAGGPVRFYRVRATGP